ncbi:MAG: acetylglutamate kinase [Clostridiales bacterium]|jgi:hypothetical protein|nr:acetylglutamate kinase [Clostridiales bacterium]
MNDNCELSNLFRKLWQEHIQWTRSFIISTAADLGDLQYVTKRLLRNPTDFYNALRPYYGEEKARRFEKLLTDHLLIASRLVNAAKAGDTETADEERRKWYANADQIARFLASINPYWSENQWKIMLREHLKLTEDEATNRLMGQYAKDIALYDIIEDQALMMADYMAKGIKKQFD